MYTESMSLPVEFIRWNKVSSGGDFFRDSDLRNFSIAVVKGCKEINEAESDLEIPGTLRVFPA